MARKNRNQNQKWKDSKAAAGGSKPDAKLNKVKKDKSVFKINSQNKVKKAKQVQNQVKNVSDCSFND